MNVNPFECDKDSKQIIGAFLKDYLTRNYNRQVTTAETPDTTDRLDLTLTSITPSNIEKKCGIEIKEREWADKPDILEYIDSKKLDSEEVDEYRKQGYIILWVSYYPITNRVLVWEADKTKRHYNGLVKSYKHTKLKDEKVYKQQYSFDIRDAIIDVTL